MENNNLSKGELFMGYGAMILGFVFLYFKNLPYPYHVFLVLQPLVIWIFYEEWRARKKYKEIKNEA